MSTPLMKQYHAIKEQHPGVLLLFQVGDFYELFFDDAKTAAACLGIALTQRGTNNGEPIPLCGVPVHAIDAYCAKLIKAGHRVALCDQLSEPQPGKVVERGVTQVLTPSTLVSETLVDQKKASYLVVLAQVNETIGLCAMELLTGELAYTSCAADHFLIESELSRFGADEVVIDESITARIERALIDDGYYVVREQTQHSPCVEAWLAERGVSIADQPALYQAVSLWYQYVSRNHRRAIDECRTVTRYTPNDFLILDAVTQRNLELVANAYDGSSTGTLFSVLDTAATAMGSRVLKKWMVRPLRDAVRIEERLASVETLKTQSVLRESLMRVLSSIGDVERVIGRIALSKAPLSDYQKIVFYLEQLPQCEALCMQAGLSCARAFNAAVFQPLYSMLSAALNTDSTKPWRIKTGYSAELDKLRMLVESGSQAVLDFEKKEQQRTGIASLKIRYNRAYGYGIEITNANAHLVPAEYTRVQTLTNRERYTTQELRDLEYDITRAQNSLQEIEDQLFAAVVAHVAEYNTPLRKTAQQLAQLDALCALAHLAYERKYVRPRFTTSRDIILTHSRHPVVEYVRKEPFIPNDVALTDEQSLWIITGPNMGGKSTYMRQVALSVLLAHMGSFVPAQSASMPIIDRIFTRIGAADKVAQGKSTFLVEMEEVAIICREATENSLVILDEVGRGTSTYDGLAIAQAVVEYMHTTVKARCLFATHYHELSAVAAHYPGVVLYHAASKQTADGVILLHKIIKGDALGSFGIEVARRAQVPHTVVVRAQELMHQYATQSGVTPVVTAAPAAVHNPLRDLIHAINYDELSPRQAFDLLWKLKELP